MEGLTKETNSNASSSAPPPPPPPWIELPGKITANILQRLGAEELLENAQKVCMTWCRVCKDPSMWRKIHLFLDQSRGKDELMCQNAVDRSQGQLVEISLCSFGTNKLLQYIAERSSQLQCLRLVYCFNITGGGLVEAAKKLSLLETLHLSDIRITGESIEQVGHSCPMLKSFTLKKNETTAPFVIYGQQQHEDDTEAVAIAKSMPQLRHLCLSKILISNKGLEAILDGCLHLESLDIDKCPYLNLMGDLGERCSRQIKSLKIANHTADCESDDDNDSADYEYDYDGFDYDDDSDDYDDVSSEEALANFTDDITKTLNEARRLRRECFAALIAQ